MQRNKSAVVVNGKGHRPKARPHFSFILMRPA
jgi:hypothetical protein